jgi:glucokinase
MEKLLCGIDLGGTKLSAALVKPDGTIFDEMRTLDHKDKDADGIVKIMAEFVHSLLQRNGLAEDQLAGVGVGFPGHIRCRDGVCIVTSNLTAGFKNYPLRQILQGYFSKTEVYVDNDANAQALGEFKYGAGRGYHSMIFMTISTGIGAGVIINGKLLRGATGTAGEVGHTIVRPESKRKCTCGNYGCLMSQACGIFLPDIAMDLIESGVPNKMGITLENAREKINGLSLAAGLRAGDELSKAVVFESADAIGIAIYNLFQLFNPPIVVLGGGLTHLGSIYTDRITEKFNFLAKDMMYDEMKIVTSETWDYAGVLGAATLPLEKNELERRDCLC